MRGSETDPTDLSRNFHRTGSLFKAEEIRNMVKHSSKGYKT